MVGVPMHHGPAGKMLQALHDIEWPQEWTNQVYYSTGSLVYAVRGQIAQRFLDEKDAHYLLFCDADMTPPKHALKTMLSRDADIVAALCCKREPPYRPVILRYWDDGAGGPIEDPTFNPQAGVHPIWGSGLAFTLIKRHVIERIYDKFGKHIFFHERLPDGDPMGEDVTFFWKANQLGFRTILDCDVQVGHLAEYPIYPADSARWFGYSSEQMIEGWKKNGEIKALKEEIEKLQKKLAETPNFALASIP